MATTQAFKVKNDLAIASRSGLQPHRGVQGVKDSNNNQTGVIRILNENQQGLGSAQQGSQPVEVLGRPDEQPGKLVRKEYLIGPVVLGPKDFMLMWPGPLS